MSTGKLRNILSKQRGTSLIEVMVSVAILGIVSIGAVSIGDQVSDQSRLNRIGNNVFQIYGTIRSRTFLETDCVNFLQNPAGGGQFVFDPAVANEDGINNPGQSVAIRLPGANGLGESLVTENDELSSLGLTIESLRITNSVFIPDDSPALPPHNYLAYIELGLTRPGAIGNVIGGSALLRKRVVTAIYIETNAANQGDAAPIESCRSASGDIDRQELCDSLWPAYAPNQWDAVTETCTPPLEPLACPVGQVLMSIEGRTPVCESLGIEDQSCPPNQYIVQLGIGYIGCSGIGVVHLTPTPGPPSTDCAAGPVNWTQNGDACTANMAFLADGGTATITDALGANTGTVDISCSGGVVSQLNQICAPGGPMPGCWEAPMVGPSSPGPVFPNHCTVPAGNCTIGDSINMVKCEQTDGTWDGFYSTICSAGTLGTPGCVTSTAEPVPRCWQLMVGPDINHPIWDCGSGPGAAQPITGNSCTAPPFLCIGSGGGLDTEKACTPAGCAAPVPRWRYQAQFRYPPMTLNDARNACIASATHGVCMSPPVETPPWTGTNLACDPGQVGQSCCIDTGDSWEREECAP